MSLWESLKLALRYLQNQKPLVFKVLFWRAIFILTPMQIPLITGAIIDGLNGKPLKVYFWSIEGGFQQLLNFTLGSLTVIAILYGVSAFFDSLERANLSRHFVATLRVRVIRKIGTLSLLDHQKYGAGELLTRTMSDTASMRQFIDRVFIQNLSNIIKVVYPAIMLFTINVKLSLVAIVVLPFQFWIVTMLQNMLYESANNRRKAYGELNTIVKESLDGMENIKMLGGNHQINDRVVLKIDELEARQLDTVRISALILGVVWLLTSIGTALVWLGGGRDVLLQQLTIGQLVSFTGFLTLLYTPFRNFSKISNSYKTGLVALKRIEDLLNSPDDILNDQKGDKIKVLPNNAISVHNLEFSYKKSLILDKVSFGIEPNQITAFVGRSGSGKSTILKLMARLYKPSGGSILINDQDMKTVSIDSIRQVISFVPQHPFLFSATLRDNLNFGVSEVTDKEILEACYSVGLREFIKSLPEGLDEKFGDGGFNLSGGELQRLAIARALIKNPRFLLLDEPTSAMDGDTEHEFMEMLAVLKKNITIVLISHRAETIRYADHVFLIDHGKIALQGKHHDLMEKSEDYHKLFP